MPQSRKNVVFIAYDGAKCIRLADSIDCQLFSDTSRIHPRVHWMKAESENSVTRFSHFIWRSVHSTIYEKQTSWLIGADEIREKTKSIIMKLCGPKLSLFGVLISMWGIFQMVSNNCNLQVDSSEEHFSFSRNLLFTAIEMKSSADDGGEISRYSKFSRTSSFYSWLSFHIFNLFDCSCLTCRFSWEYSSSYEVLHCSKI